VATNITIEHNGAEVGMLTTRGFRDILHIGRHKRPHNFSLHFDVPWQSRPLVKRRNRIAITERIMPPTGKIETPLAEDEVREACALFRKRGITSVCVGFMFSFLNDAHERRARDIVLEEIPGAYVSISSEVANVVREYERFSTVAMNAYVGPRSAMYLRNLEAKVAQAGIPAKLRVIQSNGGISSIEGCARKPVGILMSGPAGGVLGALAEARLAGVKDILTIDIGGTSADVSTIADGRYRIKNARDTVVSGHAVMAPMIDLETIGAGADQSPSSMRRGLPCRPALGRIGTGPGLLWARGHRAHGDRRAGGAGADGSGQVPGRRPAARSGSGASRHQGEDRRSAGHFRDRGGAGHHQGHQQ
jgi:N-methylhydantoinase A